MRDRDSSWTLLAGCMMVGNRTIKFNTTKRYGTWYYDFLPTRYSCIPNYIYMLESCTKPINTCSYVPY